MDFAPPAEEQAKSAADNRVGGLRQITARNKVDAILLSEEGEPATGAL